jgi:hypothetical protein
MTDVKEVLENSEFNKPITFAEHKERTAADCESVAKILTDLAKTIREGNVRAFEGMWIEGGTEEGDSKINSIHEMMVLRYMFREEHLIK